MNIKLLLIAIIILAAGSVFVTKFYINKERANNAMVEVNVDSKVLVAYFSRTGEQYGVGVIEEGNTAIVAKMIAEKTGADLFEIKVKNDNYPSKYTELTEYAKKEKTQNARPELASRVENFSDYDLIYIGYPNWWDDMPMPVYTFIESYDFKDKTIAPFTTHEGSGFTGESALNKTDAKVLKGLGIYGHVAQTDRIETDRLVTKWINSLEL